jgi:acyl-CoA synthetase (AMP-forming)/AMP-acid ligase II
MSPLLTTLSAGRLALHRSQGLWQDDTLYALALRHALARPDQVAVRDRERALNWRDLVAAADRLAADFTRRGLRPGRRVAVWLPSRVETAVALLACSRNGLVCCPSLHRDHTVGDIVALLGRMRAEALVAQPGYGADAARYDIFAEAAKVASLRHAYVVPAEPGVPFDDLPAAGGPAPHGDPNAISYLAFTSGTTGQPKGVMHSDNTLLANARAMSADWHFNAGSVLYTMSPLSHNLGLGALICTICVGGELVLHDLPRGASLFDRLVETGASFLFGVPTHAIDLLRELQAREVERVGRLEGFRISGAAASAEVIAALMRHGVVPQAGYGMTETCSHQYTLPDDAPERIRESCGRACPGYEVRIVRQDDPEIEVPAGEIGQIVGRGASLMLGYFDDQAATEDNFTGDGWFLTGDLGSLDAQGYLRITGRKKDLIIRGGHNIYPARIEALAGSHPAVDKAVVFPVPDERLGEKVCLAVVPMPGQQPDVQSLLSHLDEQGLSRYDMPEYLLVLSELPLTASGKILKRDLVRWVAEGRVQPVPVRWQGNG